MTCIVGIEKNGKVHLGGDSCGSNGYSQLVGPEPKVFRNGEFVIGYTTSFRFGQLLQYKLVPPKHPAGKDDHAFLCTDVVDAMRACLKDGGYARISDNTETGGQCLIGYRGRLYYMDNDFQIRRACYGIGAVGAGQMVALGALSVGPQNLTPRQRLERALQAASEFVVGVTPPFHYIASKRYTRAAA